MKNALLRAPHIWMRSYATHLLMDKDSWNIITKAGSSDVEAKKSHFLGALKAVRSEEDALNFIASVRKQHYDARHNCFAMRIGRPGAVFERSGDDGEPSGTAGKPMLDILKGEGLYDICAVVTRYFGGTLLGTGGLVRAYSDALKEALKASRASRVRKGVRLKIVSDYPVAERIKRQALQSVIHLVNEEYTEVCTLYYIAEEGTADQFASRVKELSLGKSEAEVLGEALFYGDDRIEIYSVQ